MIARIFIKIISLFQLAQQKYNIIYFVSSLKNKVLLLLFCILIRIIIKYFKLLSIKYNFKILIDFIKICQNVIQKLQPLQNGSGYQITFNKIFFVTNACNK